MAAPGKFGKLCQALLLAASVTAVATGVAYAQQSDDLGDLAQRILDNPQDVDLNLRYAHAAEAAGKPRLALATYERILINDPNNAEARSGYERVRRQIEPGYTTARLEAGVRWDSDPHNVSDAFFFDSDEATTYYAKVMVANESEFVGARWRSILNVDVEETPDASDLNYEYIGAQTGPILYLGPHLAALPAVGVATSWLGGDHYYNEGNLSLGVEGRGGGASYWGRIRAGYRDYDHDTSSFFSPVTEQGKYFELTAGYARPNLFSDRDLITIEPFVRWSDVDGAVFDFFIFDDLSPGKYAEYGADINYNYQLSDHFLASVGAQVRERNFADSVRKDTYISPQASLTWQDALPCNCDLRLQYRHRDNDSNDASADYGADQVSLALITRF
ncbi:MAG: outer membrane beta-barrel protein [Terricaulis sp.]